MDLKATWQNMDRLIEVPDLRNKTHGKVNLKKQRMDSLRHEN